MSTLKSILLYSLILLTIEYSVTDLPKDVTFAKKYLKQFHYLSPNSQNPDKENFRTALQMFQIFMNLPMTGKLDDATITEMKKPRCGDTDLGAPLKRLKGSDGKRESNGKRGLNGPSWDHENIKYGFWNTGDDMSPAKVKSIFKKAFKIWSDKTILNFKVVDNVNTADIKIRFARGKHAPCAIPFDGRGNILAHAFYPQDGDIHLDDDEIFTDGTYENTNLLSVAAHEIGHAIGVGHTSEKLALMYPEFGGYDPNLRLHNVDINAVAHLYGGPTVAIPTVRPTVPARCLDRLDDCPKYAHLCNTSCVMVHDYCPSTCKDSCPTVPRCRDIFPKNICEYAKAKGLCSTQDVIKEKCQKTCKTPGSKCEETAMDITWNRTNLTYGLSNTSNDMSSDKVKSILKKAFKTWSDKTILNFTYVDDVNTADIKIRFFSKQHPPCSKSFDGPGNHLAHSFNPKSTSSPGEIHIDKDEKFTEDTTFRYGINLLAVVLHEIGHVLGLKHSSEKTSVMYPEYKFYEPILKLHADDINAVSFLYGGPTVPVKSKPVCRDFVPDCSSYSSACSTSDSMKKYCPYTCYVCRVAIREDLLPDCSKYGHECDTCEAMVDKYCPKTCYGFYPSIDSCVDKYSSKVCLHYKVACKSPYIRPKCKKTCKFCYKY